MLGGRSSEGEAPAPRAPAPRAPAPRAPAPRAPAVCLSVCLSVCLGSGVSSHSARILAQAPPSHCRSSAMPLILMCNRDLLQSSPTPARWISSLWGYLCAPRLVRMTSEQTTGCTRNSQCLCFRLEPPSCHEQSCEHRI